MPFIPNVAGPFRGFKNVTQDYGEVAANSTDVTNTVTWPGIDANSVVLCIAPSLTAGLLIQNPCKCTKDTVTIRFANVTGSPINPGSQDYYFVRL